MLRSAKRKLSKKVRDARRRKLFWQREKAKQGGVKTYFVSDERGFIKIGFATNLRLRLIDIQNGCSSKLKVLLVIDGNHEKRLHKKFQHLRASGEWFKSDPEIWEEIFILKAELRTATEKKNAEIEKEIDSLSEERWAELTTCVELLLSRQDNRRKSYKPFTCGTRLIAA